MTTTRNRSHRQAQQRRDLAIPPGVPDEHWQPLVQRVGRALWESVQPQTVALEIAVAQGRDEGMPGHFGRRGRRTLAKID